MVNEEIERTIVDDSIHSRIDKPRKREDRKTRCE